MRLRIGVTGHRVLVETGRIEAAIDEAVAAIERAFPNRPLIVLSSLAEGADRVVVERVLARPEAALHAVLPMARVACAAACRSAGSRRELDALLARAEELIELPARATAEASYAAAGAHIVARSEVLLAVWDGCPARGPGGTGAVVELARARRLPLAWVRAGNRDPGTEAPTTLGPVQGQLVLERLEHRG